MARIVLLGFGRMGKMIEGVALERGHAVVARFGPGDVGRPIPSEADVAIDFSLPTVAESNCRRALQAGVPVVSGTTGWDPGPLLREVESERRTAFLHATNMSVGVNVTFAINRLLANALAGRPYAAHIHETHHVHKLDAPSGTALTLAEGVVAGLGHVAPPTSERTGEVIGLHEVTYTSADDAITLRHEAFTRNGFALGAVLAAEFSIGKRGVFTMNDVLGLGSLDLTL